jgi:hypothetical protein
MYPVCRPAGRFTAILSRLPLSPHPEPFANGVWLLPADPTAVMMIPVFEMFF